MLNTVTIKVTKTIKPEITAVTQKIYFRGRSEIKIFGKCCGNQNLKVE